MEIKKKLYLNRKKIESFVFSKTNRCSFLIITVSFNNEHVIEKQIACLKDNCKIPDYRYIVFDNSSDKGQRKRIKQVCKQNCICYFLLPNNRFGKDPSFSHGMALNWIFKNVIKRIMPQQGVLLLDHDIFPIKPFELSDVTENQKIYGWLFEDSNSGVSYIWPGFFYINVKDFCIEDFDFTPNFGADTGSGNKPIFDKMQDFKELKYAKLDRKYLFETTNRQSSQIDIFDERWIHLVNGSDWANCGNVNEKLDEISKIYMS